MITFRRISCILVCIVALVLGLQAVEQDQQQAPQPQGPAAAPQSQRDNTSTPQNQPETQTVPEKPTESAPAEEQKSSAGSAKPTRTRAHHTSATKRGVSKGSKPKKTPTSTSGKVIVRNGGAKEGQVQLAPATPQEQQLHDRENTEQLLSTTDANLKSVSARQLSSAQQSMLDQIHTYVRQAKQASDSGDLTRAHTLAYKAHLLSDELAKK